MNRVVRLGRCTARLLALAAPLFRIAVPSAPVLALERRTANGEV